MLAAACGGDDDVAPQRTTTEPPAVVESTGYDLQGHRGARGLRPENTLPAFQLALDLMVDTLELDMHLTADDIVVVWHDPVVSADKCDAPADGEPMIRGLSAAELADFQCDRNPDPGRFPEQEAPDGGDYHIAALAEVFTLVATYADDPAKTEEQRANAATVRFNIETKRVLDSPENIDDGFDGENPGPFELAVLETIEAAGVAERTTIQSFDHRSLWAIRSVSPSIPLAALTRRGDIPDFAELAANGATIWSPDYRSVDADTLAIAHDAGLRVIPWTVNNPDDMQALLTLGVDGLITDRPDLAP